MFWLLSRLSYTDSGHTVGNADLFHRNFEARTFYSYALQRLPGVVRSGKPSIKTNNFKKNSTEEQWRPFNT